MGFMLRAVIKFLVKMAVLGLIVWGLYVGYKEVFKPFMDTAKNRVRGDIYDK